MHKVEIRIGSSAPSFMEDFLPGKRYLTKYSLKPIENDGMFEPEFKRVLIFTVYEALDLDGLFRIVLAWLESVVKDDGMFTVQTIAEAMRDHVKSSIDSKSYLPYWVVIFPTVMMQMRLDIMVDGKYLHNDTLTVKIEDGYNGTLRPKDVGLK